MNMSFDEKKYYKWLLEQEYLARESANETLKGKNKMIKSCHVFYTNPKPEYAVICIPGRANDGAMFARDYHTHSNLKNTVFVGPTPVNYAWYPMPVDSNNQKAALSGLPKARKAIESVQEAVEKRFGIPKSKTSLVGFSAGGVMAIQAAAFTEEPYSSVVCHSGAILEPSNLPSCKHYNCPVLLTHNADDYCFDWFERYEPMKNILIKNGYPTYVLERKQGGHQVSRHDIEQSITFMTNYGLEKKPEKSRKDYISC